MLSVIIPVYVEPYLNRTINSLLENAVGDIEIIPVFDGEQKIEPLLEDSRVKPLTIPHSGMRAAINAGVAVSTGEYLMKIDAHCAISPGYDKEFTESCEHNWIVIPVFYAIDEDTWERRESRLKQIYHYLSFPCNLNKEYGRTMMSVVWQPYPEEWDAVEFDDTMTLQGGCWVVNKDYFMRYIFPMDDKPEAYGTFTQEYMELGNKYWLGGGAVKVNKKIWYAHLNKRKHHYFTNMFSRLHRKDGQVFRSCLWSTEHWMNNKEPNMVRPFSWLVEKFWPVPFWPENWQAVWNKSKC